MAKGQQVPAEHPTKALLGDTVPSWFNLGNIRELFGFTQPRFARALRVHPITLAKWETGAQRLSQRHIGRLYDVVARLVETALLAKVPKGERKRTKNRITLRALLFSVGFVHGPDALLTREEWTLLLNTAPGAFRDLPAAGRDARGDLLWGYDVGAAINALLQGRPWRDVDRAYEGVFGARRLIEEIALQYELTMGALPVAIVAERRMRKQTKG